MLNYHEVINEILKMRNLDSYLELGVRDPRATFNNVQAGRKAGVDINPGSSPTFCMSTDDFFLQNKEEWDVVFIDACHETSQVTKDFENSLKCLSSNGVIIMDDINPEEEWLIGQEWCGDAWFTFANLAKQAGLKTMAIEGTRFGLVTRGIGVYHDRDVVNEYSFLADNRVELLNITPYSELQSFIA